MYVATLRLRCNAHPSKVLRLRSLLQLFHAPHVSSNLSASSFIKEYTAKHCLHGAQIVFLVLGCWGVGIYTAIKVFGGKKKEAAPAAA